jgi:hypothetical protein
MIETFRLTRRGICRRIPRDVGCIGWILNAVRVSRRHCGEKERSELMASSTTDMVHIAGFSLNRPPAGFSPERDLPRGFVEFLTPLHEQFAPRQAVLLRERNRVLAESHQGEKPTHRFPASSVRNGWRIELP